MISSPRMKVGVVGVGRMGVYHLQKYLAMPNVEVAGVHEINLEYAAAAHAKYGVRIFDKLDDLLFETDAISIASPTLTHYSVARQALEAGVHVLVEKPITHTIAEAEDLIRLSEERKLVLQVGFVERFRYLTLAKGFSLTAPRFIEGHRLTSSPGREDSVDVVTDLMIHDLDLALSLMKEDPIYVSAIGMPVVTSKVDIANVRMEFPSGGIVNLNASRVSAKPFRKFRVFSAQAYASLDFISNGVEVIRRNGEQALERSVHEPKPVDALREQCEQFLQSVRESTAPVVTGRDALRALRYATIIREKIAERDQRTLARGFFEESPAVN